MSAPETNIEKQKRRHGPVRIGIVVAVAVAVLAIMLVTGFGTDDIEDQAAPAVEQSN